MKCGRVKSRWVGSSPKCLYFCGFDGDISGSFFFRGVPRVSRDDLVDFGGRSGPRSGAALPVNRVSGPLQHPEPPLQVVVVVAAHPYRPPPASSSSSSS